MASTVKRETHLASESKRGLVKALLLRVANIRVDDAAEWQLVSRIEFVAEVLSLDSELAADGILHVE